MSASSSPRMSADEFIEWAMLQPEDAHYELVEGRIVGMAPERVTHVRAKFAITRHPVDAIAAAGLSCESLIHGAAVQVDHETVYEPDALVRCGPPLPGDTVEIIDPVIVVEVVSPSSRTHDNGKKLADYVRIPSLRHYLVVDAERKFVIHHGRASAEADIITRIVRDGRLTLDPPGLRIADLFAQPS